MSEPRLSADDIATYLAVTKDPIRTWVVEKENEQAGAPVGFSGSQSRRLGSS